MARLVMTKVTPSKGFKIVNVYKDGTTSETSIMEGDIITDLSFTGDNEKITATGKITNISFKYKKFATKSYVSEKNNITNDASVTDISLDASTEYNSAVYEIDTKDILEYNPEEGKEIVKVNILPILIVDLECTLSDDSVTKATIKEGDTLFNVTVLKGYGNEYTDNFKVSSFIYNMESSGSATLLGMYLISPERKVKVEFTAIKSCGEEGIVVEDLSDLQTSINNYISSGSDSGVVLSSGECATALNLTSSVTMLGNKAYTVANSGIRRTDEIADDETVLKGEITLSKDSVITITGVALTADANIKIEGAGKVAFKNCKFTNINPNQSKSFLLHDTFNSNENGTLIEIENCYFGSNYKNSVGVSYNLFELNCKVADGSYIKNCYFAKEVCTHNPINLYDVVDGATITIEDNYFEVSKNACRIGFIGAPQNVTVNFNRNTYAETDPDPAWAGLVIVQPYTSKTTSFAGVTINLNNTKYEGDDGFDQIIYIYFAGNDTVITEENEPIVYVNGERFHPVYVNS